MSRFKLTRTSSTSPLIRPKKTSAPPIKRTKDNRTATSSIKGVGVSIQKNPIRDTNFFTKTNTSSATVVNILEKGKNGAKPQSVFRIDGPHQSPPKPMVPHLNTNKNLYPDNKIYQSLNHKHIPNAALNVAKNYDKIGKYAKVGGRALTGLVIASDTVDIYDSD